MLNYVSAKNETELKLLEFLVAMTNGRGNERPLVELLPMFDPVERENLKAKKQLTESEHIYRKSLF